MGIHVIAGRDFSPTDMRGTQQAAIISENLARYYFPGQNPIGRRVGLQRQLSLPTEIVGVVRDVRFEGIAADSPRMVYLPAAQEVNHQYASDDHTES